MNRSERPLRILCVINLPWDARLGASRVWMELAGQWRGAGHAVDHYSLSEAFPKPTSRNTIFSLRQVLFVRRAARFIRKNASRYDVIDSLLGAVPFSKKRLGFHRLLVARSVGFYWLYEKFDRHARTRWPGISRGKIAGRLFYSWTRRRALRSAAQAIRHADLFNLPNEDELNSLREDLHSDKPAIVQPYGLTAERRSQLAQAALTPEARLASGKICFVGMWSVRKGARDLGEIVRRIRLLVPGATFRFLGTFAEAGIVLRDLGLEENEWCEVVEQYDPAALPALLSDCTAGIFPSYVEGFGLALLEQLASGIPTVAYDAPGPRQILNPAREQLLVLAGDVSGMSQRIASILHSSVAEYAALQKKSSNIAAQYSWPEIASNTIELYRAQLRKNRGPLIFVQPFGWRSPGGGARIMRALLQNAPLPFEIVCTSPQAPPRQRNIRETHLSLRPNLGRLERSRFAGLAHKSAPLFAGRFRRRLERKCANATAIHAVAHGGLDFAHAFDVAEKLRLPFFLHVHDDFLYSAQLHRAGAIAAISRAWSGAAARFTISHPLGQEYQRRYGSAGYVVVTDGVENIPAAPLPRAPGALRVYFMGLFHLAYEPNLRALVQALQKIQRPDFPVTVTMRCGGLRRSILDSAGFIRVLPFAEEEEVERDLTQADLLYLPLPFASAHASFVRFSLSTKVVTYLGSGVPILYHGPRVSAVGELLANHAAAFFCYSLDPAELASVLGNLIDHPAAATSVAAHALTLARASFSLGEIRQRFWNSICHSIA